MPGSAGSKFGVIYDDIPLKNGSDGKEARTTSKDALKDETSLKDLRLLINARLKRNPPVQMKP